jgi:hypothetical protein
MVHGIIHLAFLYSAFFHIFCTLNKQLVHKIVLFTTLLLSTLLRLIVAESTLFQHGCVLIINGTLDCILR